MTDQFNIGDLERRDIKRITNRHRVAIASVVLGFARLDTRLSDWIVQAFEMRHERGAMLIQNMSIDNKIQRLIKLFEHEGPRSYATELKARKKAMSPHYEVRNLICHAACLGTWAKDRDYLLFAPLNYIPGSTGMAKVEAVSIQAVKLAADWAETEAASYLFASGQHRSPSKA